MYFKKLLIKTFHNSTQNEFIEQCNYLLDQYYNISTNLNFAQMIKNTSNNNFDDNNDSFADNLDDIYSNLDNNDDDDNNSDGVYNTQGKYIHTVLHILLMFILYVLCDATAQHCYNGVILLLLCNGITFP